MRTYVIFSISIHLVGVALLLHRLAKQQYPIPSESTSKDDVTRVIYGLAWVLAGMYVLTGGEA